MDVLVPWTVRTSGLEEVVPWLVLITDGCEAVPWLVLTDRTRATGDGTTLLSGCGNLTDKQVLEEGLAWCSDLSPRLGRCNLRDCSLACGLLIYWRIQSWSHIFLDLASRAATFNHRLPTRPLSKRTCPSKASSRLSKLCQRQCPSWSTTHELAIVYQAIGGLNGSEVILHQPLGIYLISISTDANLID